VVVADFHPPSANPGVKRLLRKANMVPDEAIPALDDRPLGIFVVSWIDSMTAGSAHTVVQLCLLDPSGLLFPGFVSPAITW
jgi:hypothetical protein